MPEIKRLLEEELDAYKSLKGELDGIRRALDERDTDSVERRSRAADSIRGTIEGIEEKRMDLVRAAAARSSGEPEDVRLADLLIGVPDEEMESVRAVAAELRTVVESVRDIASLNERLISDNLEIIRHTLRILESVSKETGTYGNTKAPESAPPAPSRLLDRKA